MGLSRLIAKAVSQFPDVKESEIRSLIEQLCQEDKVKIVNPDEKPEAQSICLVPHK
jgi:hypothetical protein